jgi:hypothetical protein
MSYQLCLCVLSNALTANSVEDFFCLASYVQTERIISVNGCGGIAVESNVVNICTSKLYSILRLLSPLRPYELLKIH